MKRCYDITINGEFVLCYLNVVQAYWIAAALFVAGYWKPRQRVRVTRNNYARVEQLYYVYVQKRCVMGETMPKWKANVLVFILRLLRYKDVEKIPF